MPWSNARPKASASARGYNYRHRKLREQLLPSASGTACVRCGEPMLPGQALEFDHNDERTGYLGFSHKRCNQRAGARKARRIQMMTQAVDRVITDRW